MKKQGKRPDTSPAPPVLVTETRTGDIYTPEQRQRKRRIIHGVIAGCLILIPLLAWLQKSIYKYEPSLPISNDVVIFSFINVNLLLVLLVLYLILRSLAELLFERKIKQTGSKIKTKLIASFLSLSFFPALFLFLVALHFVSTSMDYWFNSSIDESLQKSLELAQSMIQDSKDEVQLMSDGIAERLEGVEITSYTTQTVSTALNNILSFNIINGPDAITLQLEDSTEISVLGKLTQNMDIPKIPVHTLQKIKETGVAEILVQHTSSGDLVTCVREVHFGKQQKRKAILITSVLVKSEQLSRMTSITKGIESYRQLKHFKDPFKLWLIIILLMVTLLIFFAAIWFGIHISRGITNPLAKLVDATRRVADGDLEFEMEREANDEIGLLVNSFNQMTTNLNASNKELAETYAALQMSSQESEQRRRYIEIILQSVSAGVISIDEHNHITTFNRFAENLLNIDKSYFIGHKYSDILPEAQSTIIDTFIAEIDTTGKSSVEQHLKINVRGKTYSLLVTFTKLEDEAHTPLGYVLVFDNLTKMEKMQRIAAWREVARRIAHEIKNPLTPIQLSAQRLRRKYPAILAEEDGVFDQCTDMIIQQVDELKRLVSEFSRFARMPRIEKTEGNILELVNATLILYREAHKDIAFSCTEIDHIPPFPFDYVQIKRCVINLVDNAVAVLPRGGTIAIEISHDLETDMVVLKIADSGPGISKENKTKLFEPYFSTKKTGTGLGLAIVSTIVVDHGGTVRVQDNQPHGSVFILELPMHESTLEENSGQRI